MSFAIFSMIFQGCEKEEIIPENDLPFLSIEGDLNNPQTLLKTENFIIFNTASERIVKHLSIENNRMFCDINDGAQIAISNELFLYLEKHYKEINKKIDSSEITLSINARGHIVVHNKNYDMSNKKVRLKSGDIEEDEDGFGQMNLIGMSNHDIIEQIGQLFSGLQSGSIENDYLDEYIDLDSVFGGDSYDLSKSGSYATNSVTIVYTIGNPCYNTPDNHCWSSYIGSTNIVYDSQDRVVYKQILNTSGNGLVSLWYTYP